MPRPSALVLGAALLAAATFPTALAHADACRPPYTDACEAQEKVAIDGLRLRAEQRIGEANRDASAEKGATYDAAAALYLQIWTDHGEAACEARRPACARMEEVIHNAARAFQGARRIDEAISTRRILLDPRHHLDHTEIARRAVYEIGGSFMAMARYEEAAPWFERFALESPAAEKAAEALRDAILLRLALGQTEQAERDADAYAKHHGSKRPAETAQVAFAIGMNALEHEDHEGARRRLSAAMARIDRDATIDVQVRAHAGLGQALAELGKRKDAAGEYDKVRALYRDPPAVLAKMASMDEGARDRTLARVLTGVGEAAFFFAEEKRRAVDAVKRPAPAGADVAAYTRTTLPTWLAQQRGAISEAEKAYAEVVAIQPFPPPRWVVDAAARVARMHGKLAAQIRSAPAPKGLSDEARAAWVEALDEVSAPERARARAAYRRCVDLSVKYQHHDGLARGCASWLSRHYPAEYPRLDEIAGSASHVAFAMESQAVPDPRRPPPAPDGG
jgi:tetratricopeptide (TPR) repeat protein